MNIMKFITIVFSALLFNTINSQGVAINSNGAAPDSSAILDLSSSNKGFLPPRMDSIQRNAIYQPSNGLVIFNISTGYLNYYSNGQWVELHSNGSTQVNDFRIGFSSSATWTCPQGVNQVTIELWGGGGGGGGGSGSKDYPFPYGCSSNGWNYFGSNGGNGGNGGYNRGVFSVTPGASYTIIIGNGGVGGTGGIGVIQQSTSNGSNGQNGGLTSFNNVISAPGGLGGFGGTAQNLGQYNGLCSNGNSGLNASITNFNATNFYIPSTTSSRSYLPVGYVHQGISPSCCSNGGTAGVGGAHSNGANGQNGENGYLILHY